MNAQPKYKLVSHILCPYVQRSVITLKEKGIAYERINIDLANKPEWFLRISPLGKVPLLIVDDEHVLFESNVITEYLNEVTHGDLHDQNPLIKAKPRAWIEYGSGILNDIAGLYSEREQNAFDKRCTGIHAKFERLNQYLDNEWGSSKRISGYFSGDQFHLVDAVYGPIFRYFDVFDTFTSLPLFDQLPNINTWRESLKQRPSVRQAVSDDYPALLRTFVINRGGVLAGML